MCSCSITIFLFRKVLYVNELFLSLNTGNLIKVRHYLRGAGVDSTPRSLQNVLPTTLHMLILQTYRKPYTKIRASHRKNIHVYSLLLWKLANMHSMEIINRLDS